MGHGVFGTDASATGAAAAPPVDATWVVTGFPWEGTAATGTLWLVYGSDNGVKHTALEKPLIYAIGFPGGMPYATVYEPDLLGPWLGAGYDLVIAAYGQYDANGNPIMLASGMPAGTDYIQRNALMMVAAIQAVISHAPNASLTVVGSSMGGLVLRYALRYMENHGMAHQTDTYVSLDSPHRGLNIPVGLQWVVSLLSLGEPTSPFATPGPLQLLFYFGSPAGRQMLIYAVPPAVTTQTTVVTPSTLTDPLHDALFNRDPNFWTFPQGVRRLIGVSDGNGAGQVAFPQLSTAVQGTSTSGALTIWTMAGASLVPLEIGESTIAGIALPGQSMIAVVGDTQAYDGAPGSVIPSFEIAGIALKGRGIQATVSLPTACFVPTVSSLAIAGATSVNMPIPPTGAATPFNDYMFSDKNYFHGTNTPAILAFLNKLLIG